MTPALTPVRATGPDGPWRRETGSALDRLGHAVVWGRLDDWDGAGTPQAVLSTGEMRRAASLSGRRRAAFVASRLLLRHAAAHALAAAPAEIDVARAPGGRPYLRGFDGLDVSVSHTGDLVAVALSRAGRIGVDVEPAARTVRRLDEGVFTPYESAASARWAGARRARALIRLWTLKEAYGKALGLGLRLPFGSFGFTAADTDADGPARLVLPDGTPADPAGWRFLNRTLTPAPAGAHILGLALRYEPPAGLDSTLGAVVLSTPRPGAVRGTGPRTASPGAAAASGRTARSRVRR
ncbi:4'-phosphopantetheinyl transferase superfamily protein [Streptomyces lincolnensis]|uniref:4'-phosphopantetheinyl transferase family protein n=1 Tax=Streptomyces lincolnensis TaxID=1915 RepID=UPI001E36D805|nr:4'-phosphopantetheinyl transferase superfamily protein [Streptomyces lincolnensis]MCD7439427.1 4'-phosphopantetheinyl transferase superfamily protein [Streptomyces lincolnensis]